MMKVLERQLRMQEREINRQMDKMTEKEKELSDKQKFIENREHEILSFTQAFDRCMVIFVYSSSAMRYRLNMSIFSRSCSLVAAIGL